MRAFPRPKAQARANWELSASPHHEILAIDWYVRCGSRSLSSACLGAPSLAQKCEAAALSARINELSRAGKYAEAIPLAQRQVESLEKKFGPAHRDVGAALNNLAQLYGDQGSDAEAEPLFKRSIAILEKTAGLDSPEIAAALNNLAALVSAAAALCRGRTAVQARAGDPREGASARDHPDVGAVAQQSRHALREAQGRHAESEPLFKRALAIYEKAAGPDIPRLRPC